MTITIISVGARPKPENSILLNDFLKRLPKHIHVSWHFVKHGSGDPASSKQQEAEAILRALGTRRQKVVLLDEKGKQLSSPELANVIFGQVEGDVCFIIGGAYGVSPSVEKRADLVWSLGKLVYPHQLVRVILAEQLYRAHCIHIGHPYHHE
jgi:23S rRNA (pseudouridine1915-N3)-methyltransferase